MNQKIEIDFKNYCGSLKINIGNEEMGKFLTYKDLLISQNKKMNLTAITEDKEIFIKHFADSLSAFPFIGDNKTVIDVGTGAGFPSVPLRIVKSDISLTLLDSLNKRVSFLEKLLDMLDIKDVSLINDRAENAGQNIDIRESFDISISRAVAHLSVLSEYCIPFVKIGGRFIVMKSANASDEIKDAMDCINKLGGEISSVKQFDVFGNERSIIEIIKIKETPCIYPRRAGVPSKRPLSKYTIKKQ